VRESERAWWFDLSGPIILEGSSSRDSSGVSRKKFKFCMELAATVAEIQFELN
jgi:hypothetical protein